jgi:hypothetical protein
MENWRIGLIALGSLLGALVAIFFCYQVATTFARIEESFEDWATKHGYRVIRREPLDRLSKPPFSSYGQYMTTYFIVVEDKQRRLKTGWIRLGPWYIVGFSEKIEVRWND